MSSDTMYLDNLDQFVHDEDKVVTYKWLSYTLQVHVNQAKQMLYEFVQSQRQKQDSGRHIHVTYFVAGFSKAAVKCAVVPEDELIAFKSLLDQVTSTHIFSVQKAKLKDSAALYITDFNALRDNLFQSNKFSAVCYKKAKLRSDEQLNKIAESILSRKEDASSANKSAATKRIPCNSGIKNGSSNHSEKPAAKSSIASMFASAGKKDNSSKPDQIPSPAITAVKETPKPQAVDKKKGSVMTFFSNHTGKTNKSDNKKLKEPEPCKPDLSKSNKTTVPPTSSKKTRSYDSDSDNNHPQKKKRKRIKDVFDTSSEDEMEEGIPSPSPPSPPAREPEEMLIADTEEKPAEKSIDDDNVIPATPQEKMKRKHVRHRKLVPKTYLDEDGFMVTEKVYESESASEIEEVNPAEVTKPALQAKDQVTSKKTSPQKKNSPSKGSTKQMSLTSFFTKK